MTRDPHPGRSGSGTRTTFTVVLAVIRTAESLVPMATYTGWNFRNPSIGGTSLLVSLLGSRIPFPRTAAEHAASHDPRKAVEERYSSRDSYLADAKRVAETLVKNRYLLTQDVPEVIKRIEEQWSVATGR